MNSLDHHRGEGEKLCMEVQVVAIDKEKISLKCHWHRISNYGNMSMDPYLSIIFSLPLTFVSFSASCCG